MAAYAGPCMAEAISRTKQRHQRVYLVATRRGCDCRLRARQPDGGGADRGAVARQAAGWTWIVRVHMNCGGPCGSPAKGAVIVDSFAVPGLSAWHTAVSAP